MRRAEGLASARRIGPIRASTGENQRMQITSKPLICRAQSGKNQIMGRRASNTLHHRKPGGREGGREGERGREGKEGSKEGGRGGKGEEGGWES